MVTCESRRGRHWSIARLIRAKKPRPIGPGEKAPADRPGLFRARKYLVLLEPGFSEVLGKILQGFLLEGITLDSSDQSNQEVTKMPLYASHERNGEKLVKNWSPDEVSVMCAIAEDEGNNLPSTGYHIVVNDYQADGYRTGDILRLWR